MDGRDLEVSEVSLTIVNGAGHALRAERIAKLAFDRLRELMEREAQHLGEDVSIALLEAPPVAVTLDTMDDDAVASAAAGAIHRALVAAR
ncbi:MAG TPA: hypothetical protein VFV34_14040 [Blastocatellia bacterium]|nr:hypothetical protein [Blastocatellia bacterium]